MSSTLRFQRIGKAFHDRQALDDVTFAVGSGELVALIGHNGSGKTTLLAIAAGVVDQTNGRVDVSGASPGSVAARRAISYVPDTPVLYDDLALVEQVGYIARMHGVPEWQPRASSLLTRLGLSDRAGDVPSTFSRGMRQKAAIAIAFVRPFNVLLLDEPFVGLDPSGQEQLLLLIAEAVGGGAAAIVATHSREFAAGASRNVALRDGRVIYDGAPSDDNIARLVDG